MGNHDYLFFYFMNKIHCNFYELQLLSEYDICDFYNYLEDGGDTMLRGFMELSEFEKKRIINYVGQGDAYTVISHNENRYILAHAGINQFQKEKKLTEYNILDFISTRIDYKKRYYDNEKTYIITGHTPTKYIRKDGKNRVFRENGHIAIDCGCAYGGRLAAYCIETQETIYSVR